MADRKETHTRADYRAESGRDKNDPHPADETWRRSEIAPFRMEVRGGTHFAYRLLFLGAGRRLE
jgi:hypothetical protein